ncbi:MAG TPA: MobV family relaxase [Pyrinomonadaceae bacterium]|jgi:hypothetical protein|nr:MobV family relaxase [Pyrinomonadaceae bacterium]
MAYAILRVAKQKGGSVGASGHHNDRTRETPNADRDKIEQNRVLVGDERNVRELVREVIDEHGGKPRSDSVECVEMVLTASPEHFLDDDEDEREKKIERFAEKALEFLRDGRNCGVCVKAVLHLDERTPHVHAHKVPIDPEGKLNAKHYLGGRQKLRELQDRYAEAMAPLGLERGREGSRATHQTVKQFYAAIEKEPVLKVSLERIPDPPSLMVTKEQKKAYKKLVLKAFNEQIAEPLRALNHQAMLARDERNRRVEVERRAAGRVAQAERNEREALARLAPFQVLNDRLFGENQRLKQKEITLTRAVGERDERLRLAGVKIGELEARRRDVPLQEVMARLGYRGEERADRIVYLSAEGRVAMTLINGQALDHAQRVVARGSLELVEHVREAHQGRECTREQALEWLADHFGEGRAAAAAAFEGERDAHEHFGRRREESRERERQPERAAPAHVRDRGDDRGGMTFSR